MSQIYSHGLYVSIAGALIAYGLRFCFSSMALIFVQSDNLQYVWFTLYRLAARPHSIYPNGFKIFLLTLVPLAFIASVPAEIVLGWRGLTGIIGLTVATVGVLWFSNWLWTRSLRQYGSASS